MFKQLKFGYVISISMDKTIVVLSFRKFIHKRYKKHLIKLQKFLVHDELNICKLGDQILIRSILPKSKMKHFEVVKILKRKFNLI